MSSFDIRVCEWLNDASISHAKKQTILNRMSVGISNYRTLELDVSHNPPTHTKRSACYQKIASESVRSPSKGSNRATSTRSGEASRCSAAQSCRASSKARSAVTAGTNITRHSRPTNASSNINLLAQQPIDVDYALQQRISKALRRIQEGDEGTPDCLLFPYRQPIVPEDEKITISVRAPSAPLSYGGSAKICPSDNKENKKTADSYVVFKNADLAEGPVGASDNVTDNYDEGFAFISETADAPSLPSQGADGDKLSDDQAPLQGSQSDGEGQG